MHSLMNETTYQYEIIPFLRTAWNKLRIGNIYTPLTESVSDIPEKKVRKGPNILQVSDWSKSLLPIRPAQILSGDNMAATPRLYGSEFGDFYSAKYFLLSFISVQSNVWTSLRMDLFIVNWSSLWYKPTNPRTIKLAINGLLPEKTSLHTTSDQCQELPDQWQELVWRQLIKMYTKINQAIPYTSFS